jgi:hypothetical protein
MEFRFVMSAGAHAVGRRCRSGRSDEAAPTAARCTGARRVFLAGRPDEGGDR